MGIRRSPKTRKKRVATFHKSKLTGEQISDFRKQGVTFEAIAALAGISKQGVLISSQNT